ncbi:type II toxin-antitoxin system Phd/YefM family antitoxin [Oceanobacillus alkalisoli]|uniref:type II toxin-antitoxin system Phd/YefM family antitoxin n=1 Tax=Oceanobacillus alkalisoli TaxID=2925113 RepID=UPI001F11C31F|nr:type II toxin-antitoxin system Phd/YefM family antitoxin [Oceanobacillus alkalisoli]MCF3942663.1 type II toxin-antitoxin system Phd/YefM family antitoxin [Oceanobacillus alkalisoli]
MAEIRPIKDLRNTAEISELCHSTKEPVFITKNGYGDLVVMSIDTYRREIARADLYKNLAEAEAQLNDGELLLDAENVFEKLRKKYGRK